MNLEHSAEIAEARLVLRWAAQDLTDIQRDCIANFLMGLPDAPLARKYQTSTDCIHQHRKEAMKKLRAKLASLGISRSADLLSDAERKPQSTAIPKTAKRASTSPRKVRCDRVAEMVGTCRRGHDRAVHGHRSPNGKIRCRECQKLISKTPEFKRREAEARKRWRATESGKRYQLVAKQRYRARQKEKGST